ncbi:hemogen isoform X3 [Pyxicephalus adspersus]|uniref:hemogen isoform X3 n=1 Tax=Pyxicephalus adspersus TaxID=30357 RepID=UPI003B5C2EE4
MEEKKEAPVISPRRLRDRELLKRKKEEAREKDTYQWVFGDQYQSRSKRPRQTRGTGNRRRKQVKEPELQLEQQLEPQPEPESKHESDQTSEPATEIQHAPETESKPMQKGEHLPEPLSQPEPINEPDHKHEQTTELPHEFKPENTLGIGQDVQQDLSQHRQEPEEHLEYHEDPVITVTEGGTAGETYAVHEEADGHIQQDITTLTEVAEVEPDTFINPPEVLNFPVQDTCTPEQEEHQYYTPLL